MASEEDHWAAEQKNDDQSYCSSARRDQKMSGGNWKLLGQGNLKKE